jgi:acetone carboxylase, gamma subunit
MTTTYDKSVIADLLDAKLPWEQLKRMMSSFKDTERFDLYLAVLQERVPWDDKILLPLSRKLETKGPYLCAQYRGDVARNIP